ncbi:MAG: NAD(P)H-hydrate dehydratase [Desulfovibrionaceae bacterium]|nr:NAD(P)H-hydrate dehydratase [Desulfovibrionaceae bacterium]MBF0513373.1 NAD(P)H-hydrate dehydratase [Desulfovibrionaceae bacterium]
MFDPLPTPAEASAWDQAAISEFGVSREILTENAARAAFSVIESDCGDLRGSRVLLFAGPGGNGGDAIALGNILADHDAQALLVLTKAETARKGAAGYFLKLAKKSGLPTAAIEDFDFSPDTPLDLLPDIVVDGLLGAGFSGELREPMLSYVKGINAVGREARVYSLDLPSGLDGLTGRPSPAAVEARATIAFEAAKTGLYAPGAQRYTGEIFVRKVGVPKAVREKRPSAAWLLTPRLCADLPEFNPVWHKGRAGHVLIVGGSPGLTGAPHLAGLGAYRGGAGLVTVACPAGLEILVKGNMAELMTWPLPGGDEWDIKNASVLVDELDKFDSIVIGPGIGRSRTTALFIEKLLGILRSATPKPIVWDADALHLLGAYGAVDNALPGGGVVTPHPGEAARMLGINITQVMNSRTEVVRKLAQATGCAAVLKGPNTLIAGDEPGEPGLCVSPFTAPCLAVGGSGDVLAGLVAALAAQGKSPLRAARLAVYWHGLAGKLLEKNYPRRGNLASEIAGALPEALTEWTHAAR